MSRVALVFVLLVGVIAAFLPPGGTVSAAQETLVVPFEYGPVGVETTNSYFGMVTITVSGFGQAAGPEYSDAFYIFTDDFGNPAVPEHIDDFGLWINDRPADDYVALPTYRDDHTYTFSIQTKGERLRFKFAVGDSYTVDNTGSFTVIVASNSQGTGKPPLATVPLLVPSYGNVGYLHHQAYNGNSCLESPSASRSHQGIDIWTNTSGRGVADGSPRGNPVWAPRGGTVVAITTSDGKRLQSANNPAAAIIVIDHGKVGGHPLFTLYAHMANANGLESFIDPSIYVGKPVETFDPLGYQGNAFGKNSSNSQINGVYITHLHFEVKTAGQAGNVVDPSPYLGIQVNRCVDGYPGWLEEFFPILI